MSKIICKAELRKQGVKPNQLRQQRLIPANVYGAGKESQSLQANTRDFDKIYQEVGDSGLFYLEIGEAKKQLPVMIGEVQKDPVSGQLLHVSFKEVDLKDKIKADIPVEVIGEFGVKEAVLVTVKDTIEVEALPTDLPENFEVNVEGLTEIGQSILLSDLDYDKATVEIIVGDEGLESPVVLVQELKEEVEEEAPVEDVEGEEGAEEGAKEGEEASSEEKSEEPAEKSAE